ncbi:MAG: C4-dicarboxylate ABC transporter permease [Deltaproteobacteria bacterium]|nr:MAG: C4-dicarboxylate ABC transporter permease [Deltaproteobacteria bacterium]
MNRIEQFYRRVALVLGKALTLVLLLMTANVFYDVIMRYFFHNSSVGMQEMEWHLFSIVVLFGISLALLEDEHVRVDFLYHHYRPTTKAMINIIGSIFFLLPLALLVFFGSFEFVKDAYEIGEISEDPGGLPFRWLIKAMIPLSFGLLIFTSFGFIVKNINLYKTAKTRAVQQSQNPVEAQQ